MICLHAGRQLCGSGQFCSYPNSRCFAQRWHRFSTWIPARHALSIDPMILLREE